MKARWGRLVCWIVGTHDYFVPRMSFVDNGPSPWDVRFDTTCSRCGRRLAGQTGPITADIARMLR